MCALKIIDESDSSKLVKLDKYSSLEQHTLMNIILGPCVQKVNGVHVDFKGHL